jgi:hypothetical protein
MLVEVWFHDSAKEMSSRSRGETCALQDQFLVFWAVYILEIGQILDVFT